MIQTRTPAYRILVVDDYEPFRRVVRLVLEFRNDLQIVGEASDGLEAVQKAKLLQPDLILLDIDLPKLNGIQVARRLRDLVPQAKILFVSVESSSDVVREALNMGGSGYVYKLHIASELLPAIETVLGGRQFVGSGLKDEFSKGTAFPVPHNHEMLIYSDDAALLESLTRFIASSLTSNDAAIVLATKSHREALAQRLKQRGFDIDSAIQQGTCILLDAAEMLSTIMVNSVPDRVLFFGGLGGLIESAAEATKTNHPRVAIFGECCGLLYAEGNLDAAISIEETGNELVRAHNNIDILCAYPLRPEQGDNRAFKNICAEHSAVSFR